MQVLLTENIRQFRRARQMTQEQLAEVLGVTVGTVSKWESGSSTPDLALIMELADFFGTSVDVLLGYRQQSAGLADSIARLRTLRKEKQYEEGRREVEKALVKYPNDFDIAYQSAALLRVAALEENDAQAARRAGELYTRALQMIDQNTDPDISRVGIFNDLATIAFTLDETERGVELLKQNNVEGVNNARIGQILAQLPDRRSEALDYLEKALPELFSQMVSVCIGYLNTADSGSNQDAAQARELALLTCRFLGELRHPGGGSLMDKYLAVLWCSAALMSEKQGLKTQADSDLRQAFELSRRYDETPSRELNLRLLRPGKPQNAAVFDDMGSTAYGSVENVLRGNSAEYPRLLRLWENLGNE